MNKNRPTEPGIYVDRYGDPWKLAANGFWYDKGYVNGMSNRDEEYLAHRAPFTLIASAAALDTIVNRPARKDLSPLSSDTPEDTNVSTSDESLSRGGLLAFVKYHERQSNYHTDLARQGMKLLRDSHEAP